MTERLLGGSESTAFVAPLILNAPIFCRFSHLKTSLQSGGARASNVLHVMMGVLCMKGLAEHGQLALEGPVREAR